MIESGVTKTRISDYFLVYCVLNVKVLKPPPFYIHVRSYKNYDPSLFSASVSQAPFDIVACTVDVNGKVSAFNDLLLESLKNHALIKRAKVSLIDQLLLLTMRLKRP